MADLSKSLTPSELADLKAKAKAAKRPGPKWAALRDLRVAANPETILRLIDMIEQRDVLLARSLSLHQESRMGLLDAFRPWNADDATAEANLRADDVTHKTGASEELDILNSIIGDLEVLAATEPGR